MGAVRDLIRVPLASVAARIRIRCCAVPDSLVVRRFALKYPLYRKPVFHSHPGIFPIETGHVCFGGASGHVFPADRRTGPHPLLRGVKSLVFFNGCCVLHTKHDIVYHIAARQAIRRPGISQYASRFLFVAAYFSSKETVCYIKRVSAAAQDSSCCRSRNAHAAISIAALNPRVDPLSRAFFKCIARDSARKSISRKGDGGFRQPHILHQRARAKSLEQTRALPIGRRLCVNIQTAHRMSRAVKRSMEHLASTEPLFQAAFVLRPVFAAHVIEQNVRRQFIVLAGCVGILYQLCQLGAVRDLIRISLASVAARIRIRRRAVPGWAFGKRPEVQIHKQRNQ